MHPVETEDIESVSRRPHSNLEVNRALGEMKEPYVKPGIDLKETGQAGASL